MTGLRDIETIQQLRLTPDVEVMRIIEEARRLILDAAPDGMTIIACVLPDDVFKRLAERAKQRGLPPCDLAAEMITAAL